jgi:hypothetical protein
MTNHDYDRLWKSQISTGTTILFTMIALCVAFHHLNTLYEGGCHKKCDTSIARYATILDIEAALIFTGSVIYAMNVLCTKASQTKLPIGIGSRAMLGLLITNFVGIVGGLIINYMQLSTIREIRDCDCAQTASKHFATFVYLDRIFKFSLGILTVIMLTIGSLYLVRVAGTTR